MYQSIAIFQKELWFPRMGTAFKVYVVYAKLLYNKISDWGHSLKKLWKFVISIIVS